MAMQMYWSLSVTGVHGVAMLDRPGVVSVTVVRDQMIEANELLCAINIYLKAKYVK